MQGSKLWGDEGEDLAYEPGRMTRAFGPNDQVILARVPGVFDYWQNKAGLRCLICRRPVHVAKLYGGIWVRHNPGQTCGEGGPSFGETYQHEVLRYWVRDYLRSQGYTATCQRKLSDTIPDVVAHRADLSVAIEIQLSDIPEDQARHRTLCAEQDGHHMLWLTHSCRWVDRLPAVGLLSEQQPGQFATTEIDGLYYSVREGLLTLDKAGRVTPGRRRPALESFLRAFLEGAWMHGRYADAWGWAEQRTWQQVLEQQAKALGQMRHELEVANSELRSCRLELVRTQELASSQSARARALERQVAFLSEERNKLIKRLRKFWLGRRWINKNCS